MNAIVVNTLTGAVSEYSGFEFQSVTPTHAGSALGLYRLGGGLDVDQRIISQVTTPKRLIADGRRARVATVFFSLKGSGTSAMQLIGEDVSYSYDFSVLPKGVSKAKPGLGFRENYVAFGYTNADGSDFKLDRIEVDVVGSVNRRTQ